MTQKKKAKGATWVDENLLASVGVRIAYEVKRVKARATTRYQELLLFEHPFLGKVLMLDGATQLTTRDEFIYHEMLVHVPILAHGKAKDILIIGGGDCGAAREVLRHTAIERVLQVEIDSEVVEVCREHLPEFCRPVFQDNRFSLLIEDGIRYVANTKETFDVIIIDSTDPGHPSVTIEPPDQPIHADGSPPDPTRFTGLMEKISKLLEKTDGALSGRQIRELVGGRPERIQKALTTLVDEDFVTVEAGPRNSTLHASATSYRQHSDPKSDLYQGVDDLISSDRFPPVPDRFPPVPGTGHVTGSLPCPTPMGQ